MTTTATRRLADLDRQHETLFARLTEVGTMPTATDEQALARYAARVEVRTALAELYSAALAYLEPNTLVASAVHAAVRDSRHAADDARQRAEQVKARIAGGVR